VTPDDREAIFAEIYRGWSWGGDESASGPGSGLERTAGLRAALADVLSRLGTKVLLDAGCGDFHWMRAADLPVRRYVGVDVVRGLIEANRRRHGTRTRRRRFVHADIVCDDLPRADLVLCRECLMHLSDAEVARAVGNLRRTGAPYLLATTFEAHDNVDIPTGDWRPINLQAPPFGFPAPVEAIPDVPIAEGARDLYADKRLSLWRFADLGPT
jgi:SAM-dependent methyltransferase